MASFGIRVTRAAFGLADHIAPSLSGRIAFELFCRTRNPNRMTARESEAVKAAEPFMAQARHHLLKTTRGRVAVHEFRPETAYPAAKTVLVIHGWPSRTEHMKAIVESLLARGFRVAALDLPGHGRSRGRRLNMASAVEAAALAGEWFGPFAAIVGHSFGGAVAVNAVVGSVAGVAPVKADRLVLISAPSSMPAIFEDFGRFLNLGTRTQTAIADQVGRVAGQPLETYVGARQLAENPVGTLVIHAPDDKEVSFDNARAFEEAGPHVALMRAPGLGHRRILSDPRVADAAAEFAAALETAADRREAA